MPRIETYGQRRVRTAALPGVRKQHSETFESRGGQVGLARADQGNLIGRVGTAIFSEAQQRERDRADDVANLQTVRAFNDLDHKLLYSEDKGILNRHGLEPHELRDEYLSEFDVEASRIAGGLKTDKQRLFFEQERIRRRDGFRNRADDHAIKSLDAYESDVFKATMASSVNAAIAAGGDGDLARAQGEIIFQGNAIKRHGASIGMAPEAQQLFADELAAKVHTGIVERMLAQGKDQLAKAYFEEAQTAIGRGDPQALERLERAVNEGVTLGKAQRAADQILAAAKTPAEAREQAKRIEDPRQRQATLQLVEHELAVKDAQERDAHQAMTLRGLNIAERTGRWTAIPPAEWAQYTVGERASIQAYLENRASGTPVKTDPSVYASLVMMAGADDPQARKVFSDLNPITLVDKLSPSDFQEIVRLQQSVKKGDREAQDKLLVNAAAQTAMVNEALVAMGFPTNPVEPGKKDHDELQYRRINAFRRSVREAVTRLEQQKGKPASDSEVQSIVDQLRTRTGRRVLSTGRLWNSYGDAYAFEEAQAQADDVADIPAGERRRIEEALRAEGIPVSGDAVLRYFNLRLSLTRKDR